MTARSDVTDTFSHRPRGPVDAAHPYAHLWDYSPSPHGHRHVATDADALGYPLASMPHAVRDLDHDSRVTLPDDRPTTRPVDEALDHGSRYEPLSTVGSRRGVSVAADLPVGSQTHAWPSPTPVVADAGTTIGPAHQPPLHDRPLHDPPLHDPPVRDADDVGSGGYGRPPRSRGNRSSSEVRRRRRNLRRPGRGRWSSAPILLRAIVTAGLVAATGVSVVRAQGGAADGTTSADSGTAANSLTDGSAVQSCQVGHSIASRLGERFTAVLLITNTGQTAVTGWTLRWAYPDRGPKGVPHLSNGWNSAVSADELGGQAIDVEASRVIPAGGSVTIAFAGTSSSRAVPAPTDFTLNGVRCR